MIISHNLEAMNALRQFNIVSGNRKKTTEKLSSGYRINRAADDAAGLAISEKMRSQIRGLEQGVHNVQNAISYCQVADGALNEVHSILGRMYELSVQSSNGSNVEFDRECLNSEVDRLKDELNNIFANTEFNTKKIWGEELTPVKTISTIKTNVQEYPAVVFNAVSVTSSINNTNKDAVPKSSITTTATDNGFTFKWTGYNGKTYQSEEIPWDATLEGQHSVRLKNYMDYTKYPEAAGIDFEYKYTVDKLSELEDVKKAFNSSSSSLGSNTSEPVSVRTTYADNSLPKITSISASVNYDAQLVSGRKFGADDTAFIESTGMTNSADAAVPDSTNFSFEFTMPGIGKVVASATSAKYSGNYTPDLNDRTGENLWWNERKTSSGTKYKSGILYTTTTNMEGIKDAITNGDGHSLWYDNASGGTISLSFSLKAASSFTTTSGGSTTSVGSMYMSISVNNSVATGADNLVDYVRKAISNINDVDIFVSSGSNAIMRIYKTSDRKSAHTVSTSTDYVETKIEYKDTNERKVINQAGANKGQVLDIDYPNLNNELLGIEDVDIATQQNAMESLDKIKEAMATVSEERSLFGAYQNRMEHSVQYEQNTAENLQSAESLIRDADMAEEVMNDAKHSILIQSGQNMIAQANQSKESVLQLLKP